MPPRRSHKKSRAGCRRCKARKIKCDEVHPRCGNCTKHGVSCDFEHSDVADEFQSALPRALLPATTLISDTTSSTSGQNSYSSKKPLPLQLNYASASSSVTTTPLLLQPPAPTAGAQPVGRLMELRLMHQFTAETYKTLSITAPALQDIWRVSVPDLAFAGSPHLMDAILAVSALHLRSIWPNDTDLVRASHAYMASSLSEYSRNLKKGINGSNAETLFLTATLIAFQSTATRIFVKEESPFSGSGNQQGRGPGGSSSVYQPPLSWFHSFQGVKTVVAASWPWLRQSRITTSIIDSQPVLQLDFTRAAEGFFGHLLSGLDEEVAELDPIASALSAVNGRDSFHDHSGGKGDALDLAASSRQAYQHAVATLNWAHARSAKGVLAFPATVSKRYVELLEERRPRALAILACFFALTKKLDKVWWLQGMARREVLGIVSLFNSDYFRPEVERKWWPHLEWAVRIALYDKGAGAGEDGQEDIPPEMWGSSPDEADQRNGPDGGGSGSGGSEPKFTSHIDMLSAVVNPSLPLPPPPTEATSLNCQMPLVLAGLPCLQGWTPCSPVVA